MQRTQEKGRNESAWTRQNLGPQEAGGFRKISEKVQGFEIRYSIGLGGGLRDVDVYDANGKLLANIDALEARPKTCSWNRERTAIIIDGNEYPLKR